MPLRALRVPRRMKLPEFLDNWHMKMVRLSALRTGRLYRPPPPKEIFLVIISVRGCRSKGHSDITGNWTRDLLACSAVAQPTAAPHAPPTPPPFPLPLRSCYFRFHFLTPIIFKSSSTDSSHLNFGFPTRWVPSGLRAVSFQQGSSSCSLKGCPSHLNP